MKCVEENKMNSKENNVAKDEEASSTNAMENENIARESPLPEKSESSPCTTDESKEKAKSEHRVVLTVSTVIACSKGSEEYCKLMEELSKKNKRTLEAPKPQQFFHCEYSIVPGCEQTVADIVSYGIAAKVFTDSDAKVIKTWDDGDKVWIAWVNSHELLITEDNIMDLYGHTLEFKLWDSKDKVSAKARFDRPKAFRLPTSKDGTPGRGVANIVAKQSQSWTSLQPKGSSNIEDVNPKPVEKEREKSAQKPPDTPQQIKIHSSFEKLAGLDIADQEKKRINELKLRQAKFRKQLNKIILESQSEKQERMKEPKKIVTDATQLRTINIPIKMELLFSGLKEITARLENPTVNVEDMYVTVSVGGKLMPDALHRKLNPLVLTVKSVKDLPGTPVPRNVLSDNCQPVYCCYKLLDQPIYKTVLRPHSEDVHFQDIHVILLGTLEKGRLLEFLQSDGLTIEVHDRDRKVPDVAKPPLIFGADSNDKKIANVGLVSSKNTTCDAFHDRHRPFDPYGVTKIRLRDLLKGNPTLTFTCVVSPCPLPDLLSNPYSADAVPRVVGVTGSIDRPENPPLPAGDYLNAGTTLKVVASLKFPLKEVTLCPTDTEQTCPFARVIYYFNYENKRLLQTLENFVNETNLVALGFDQFDRKVAEAALSTYRLSEPQRSSKSLDVITGFHVIDGEFHLFVLEGLENNAIKRLREEIGYSYPDDGGFVRMLCDTSLEFRSRLYAELDINLCKVRLHQPLRVILEQPLLYIRDLVPRQCFQCLMMINDIIRSNCLKDVCRNVLFPSHDMVISMSREFGIPITHKDFEAHHQNRVEEEESQPPNSAKLSPRWTPIDHTNREFDKKISERFNLSDQPDYVYSNIVAVQEAGRRKRPVSRQKMHVSARGPSFNYSTQTLNSTEKSKAALRKMLYQSGNDDRYAYNELYNSAIITPVDEDEHYQKEDDKIKRDFRTDTGFVYPGVKTSLLSNVHPQRPTDARADELKFQWRENTLHGHVLKPTLNRESWGWKSRHQDLNLYEQPDPEFSKDPLSIHLPGVKAVEEVLEFQRRDKETWNSKIVVGNKDMKFHSVGSRTEQEAASKQVDVLGNILKDNPSKIALRYNPPRLPALSVVSYPELDRDAREAGKAPPPGMSRNVRTPVRPLQPGPYNEYSLKMYKNHIPIRDPQHGKFHVLRGTDFTTFLKNREYLWRRKIRPLQSHERDSEYFTSAQPPAAPKKTGCDAPVPAKDEPELREKRSEYRLRYLPAMEALRRSPILPRHQLDSLSNLLDKDASIDLIDTAANVEQFLKAGKSGVGLADSETVVKDDVQIVNPVRVNSVAS